MLPTPPEDGDNQIERRFALAQGADEAARIEAQRLRRQNRELMERFAALHTGFSQTQRDARRAALNLLEDAEEARRGEQHEATERQVADAALRVSEERLRLLFHSMSEGFMLKEAVVDQAGRVVDYRITECNPAFSVQTGLRDPVGRTLLELMPGLEPFWLEHCERVWCTGEPVRFEAFCGPLGRWLSVSVSRLPGPARPRLATVVTNITARHEAEEKLAVTQERLRLIVESAVEHAIISLDRDCLVTSWNPGAERMFGYLAGEMIGRTLDPILLHEDRVGGYLEKEARQALAEGRAGGERWHRRRDGSRVWINCTMLPMNASSGGEPLGFVKILRDETANLEAREALEQTGRFLRDALRDTERARAEAEAAGQAKDHFLAVLSHELRTPLMPIQMALGALRRREDLPGPVRAAHEMIERNVELEARFIDDMLDMTRIARGKMEIVRADMDLHEAARRAVEVSAPDLEAKQQRLTVTLAAVGHRLSGDFARLQQAMWNLLKNASKFTPEGGVISLRTRDEAGARAIVVEIADSGIGMEADVIERIFNPFEQADPAITRRFGGLGLGLAIAKGTVDAHGGILRAASAGPGRGSTFTLSLPL